MSRPGETEDEKYKLVHEILLSKEVTEIEQQKDYRYPRIIFLSRPIFLKTVAIVHFDVSVPHQSSYGFTCIYRKVRDTWKLVRSFPG